MLCSACGLGWDINDPDPPTCKKVDKRLKVFKEAVLFDKQPEKPKCLPETLPHDVVAEMVKSYNTNGGSVAGMNAAYRILLDRMEL